MQNSTTTSRREIRDKILGMKTITPPLGLLEYLERVGSNAKLYAVPVERNNLALELGCEESHILQATLVLRPDDAPRIGIHPWTTLCAHAAHERLASPTQTLLLTGYPAEWLPPFGHPHLLEASLDPSILTMPCVWIPGGIAQSWMALEPSELVALTDHSRWSQVFAA